MTYKLGHAVTRITDLHLRTILGINDWERKEVQDVVVNVEMEFNAAAAAVSDDITDTLDYKKVKQQIIDVVEKSSFFLVEALVAHVLKRVMSNEKVLRATVRVDKPHALRFSRSVSVEMSAQRDA
jgi:D-erythro-7,8-dihydroneopterin triphosphate epimerase